MESKTRIGYLDSIRGLMLFWMLVVHISLNYGIIKFGEAVVKPDVFSMMSFFMTPFYFFSGYLFNTKRSFRDFTLNKINKLIIPYVFFTIFGIVIYQIYCKITNGTFDLSSGYLKSFISTACLKSNTPCWFFISLFCVSEIYYILSKHVGNGTKRIIILIAFVLAFFTNGKTQILGYGNVLLGLVYFHCGQELKNNKELFLLHETKVLVIASVLFLTLGLLLPSSLSFVLNLLKGGNYFVNFVFSLSACLILFLTLSKLNDRNKVVSIIQYFGQISLVVFAFHRPVLNYISGPILQSLCPEISYAVFLGGNLVLLLLLSVFIHKFLNKHVPWAIGDISKKNICQTTKQ